MEGGEVDIRAEYRRKKDGYSDLCNIISCGCASVPGGVEVLQAKLKICIQEKAGEREVSAEEAKINSATKRGEEVQSSEQDPPVQIFQLLGWRSIGRVKGSWGGLGGVGRGGGDPGPA